MRLVLALLVAACATPPPAPPPAPAEPPIPVEAARAKLASISPNAKQLWVVVHIRAHKHLDADARVDEARLIAGALADVDAVVHGGGDLMMLINARAELPVYERVLDAVRARYPEFPLGISALAYGPENLSEGLRLAAKYGAKVVWTEVVPGEAFEYEDDDGSYKRAVTTERDFALRLHRELLPGVMHVSGVHMKYTRPLDPRPFPDAVKAALGSVDGINITGPKTAVRADVEHIVVAHANAGGYPLGLASGVSTENVEPVLPYIDYAIVGTSLKEDGDPLRTSLEKVRALRALMTELSR